MLITVSLDVTICRQIGSFQCFGGTFFPPLQGHISELKVKAAGFCKTLVTSYETVQHHILKDNIFTILGTQNITKS